MSEYADIVGAWPPRKRAAARLRAIGCSQQYCADQVGVALRTVQHWCADRVFDAEVTRLQELAWSRVEPGIMANVELALEVQRQMFRGEIAADDKRYLAAQRLIYRILDRLLYVEPASGPDSAPAVSAVINLPGQLTT